MTSLQILRTDDFTGGLNLRANAFQLADNESPDMLNVDIDPRGGFASRGGVSRLNSTAIGGIANGSFTPKQMFVWKRAAGNQILVAANSKVFFGSGANMTDLGLATTNAYGCGFAEWSSNTQQYVYLATGRAATASYRWNGTAATALSVSGAGGWQNSLASPTGTHMPLGEVCATHADRMWVANTGESGQAYPDRVRFSHPLSPESWRDIDFIDVVGGGSGITALIPFRDSLLVFKRNAVFAIFGYDTDTFQLSPLTLNLGAPQQRAVAVDESAVYFFSWPHGVFAYDGSGFTEISKPLRPMSASGALQETVIDKVCVSVAARRVWLSAPLAPSTSQSASYVWDPSLGAEGAWVKHQLADGSAPAFLDDFVSSAGTRYAIGFHATKPFLLRLEQPSVPTDTVDLGDALPFPSYYTTRWQDAGNVSARKMWRRPDFVVHLASTDLLLNVASYRDWDDAVVRRLFQLQVGAAPGTLRWSATATEPDANPGWGEANWGAAPTGAIFQRGSSLGLSRAIKLKISSNGGAPWGVDSINYKFNPRAVRS